MAVDSIEAFMTVAELGSIQAAARHLQVSRATIRRRIEELEASVGAVLLNRTPSGAAITKAGEVLASHGRPLRRAADALIESARRGEKGPSGTLRLAIRYGLPVRYMAILHQMMLRRWPAIRFEYMYCEDPIAKLREDAHLAIDLRFGDPDLVFDHIVVSQVPFRLVASKAYLDRVGRIDDVADLDRYPLFVWADPGRDPTLLPTLDGRLVRIEPKLATNHLDVVLSMAANGAGVAFGPHFTEGVLANDLERVLPNQIGSEASFAMTVAAPMKDVPQVRAIWDMTISLGGLRDEKNK